MSTPASGRHRLRLGEPTSSTPDPGDMAGRFAQTGFAHQSLMGQYRRGLEINAHENLALTILWESGTMTMSDLGERIPLSRAAVTSLVDRLESMGYLRRMPHQVDRRRTLLELTTLPWEKSTPLWAGFPADMARIASSYTEAELALVYRFLDEVHEVCTTHASRIRAMSHEEVLELIDANSTAPA